MAADIGTPVFAGNVDGNDLSVPVNVTVVAGESIIIVVTYANGPTGLSVTCPGKTVSLIATQADVTNDQDLAVYKIENPGAGTYTITLAVSTGGGGAGQGWLEIAATPVSGCVLSSIDVGSSTNSQAAPGTGADAVTSGTAITPSAYPVIAVGFGYCSDSSEAPAAGTGWTSAGAGFSFGGGTNGLRIEKRYVTSGTTQATFTTTPGTARFSTILVALRELDAPQLSSLTPADGGTGVSTSTTLAATFNQNVSAGTGNVKVYEYTAPASAPSVITRNTDAQQTNATSFVVDTPGTPIAGDLQIIAFSKDDNEAPTGTWPPTGFLVGQSDATSTTNWAGWIYRFCDGSTDPATVTLTESSENWLSRGWLIRGADTLTAPIGGTVALATSTAANPPNLAFTWPSATEPTLVLYYVGIDGNSTFSAHPGGYTNTGSDVTTDATTGNRCGQAYGELASTTAGSDNPGALTNTSAAWKAFTIAVRGAPTDALIETIAITDGSKVTFSSATVTIDPAASLTASKDHYVTIASGAIVASDDSAPYAGFTDRTTWNFTTGAASAVAPLKVQQRAKGFPPTAPLPGIARLGFGILALTSPPVGVTDGAGEVAVSSFDVAGSGLVTFTASGTASMSSFAADGVFASTAAAGPTPMPQPQPMTRQWGTTRIPAPTPIVLGRGILATETAAAGSTFLGSGDAAFSQFALSATGLVTFTTTGSAALSLFATAASGLEEFSFTGSSSASSFAAAGVAVEAFSSTGSAACSPFAITGTAAGTFVATGAADVSSCAASGSAAEEFTATGSAAATSFACTATATESFSTSGTATLSPFATAGNAAVGSVFIGSGTSAMSPFAVAAEGLETFTGSGTSGASPFAAAGAGSEAFIGSGTSALSPFAAAGAGGSFVGVTASGEAAMSPFGALSTGALVVTGTGTAALTPFASAGVGEESFSSFGTAAMSPSDVVAAATLAFLGDGTVATNPYTVTGVAFIGSFIGVATVAMSPFATTGSAQAGAIFVPPGEAYPRVATYQFIPRVATYQFIARTAVYRK